MGRQAFEEWSERIISGACVPGVDHDSQKFALCNMLMHLSPTEHCKQDIHFISQLRKVCVNQVADAVRKEIHDKVKAKAAETDQKENEEKIKATLDCDIERTKQRMSSI